MLTWHVVRMVRLHLQYTILPGVLKGGIYGKEKKSKAAGWKDAVILHI